MPCPKIDNCPKIKTVQDKEVLPEQFTQMVWAVCLSCLKEQIGSLNKEIASTDKQLRYLDKLVKVRWIGISLLVLTVGFFLLWLFSSASLFLYVAAAFEAGSAICAIWALLGLRNLRE